MNVEEHHANFPGSVTVAESLDEARRMAEEALAVHLEVQTEDGDPIPKPSSLEVSMADAESRKAVALLVSASGQASKTARFNVTTPEDMLDTVDNFATARACQDVPTYVASNCLRFQSTEHFQ